MADVNPQSNGHPRLVLLIDADPATRHTVGPPLATSGLELVHARDSVAGLEILQRVPERFRLVIVSLEMPGLSGAVLIGALRLFRPELPVVCLASTEIVASGAPTRCATKPVQPDRLRELVADALGRNLHPVGDLEWIRADALERARRSFARSQSLLEAAREIARGVPGEAVDGW